MGTLTGIWMAADRMPLTWIRTETESPAEQRWIWTGMASLTGSTERFTPAETPEKGADGHGGFFSGLHVFTIRGFITFFTLFGWSGLLFLTLGMHWFPALFLAIQIGIIGMVAVAVILREALRLQSDGTLDVRNALGERGSVYLTVPAQGRGPER